MAFYTTRKIKKEFRKRKASYYCRIKDFDGALAKVERINRSNLFFYSAYGEFDHLRKQNTTSYSLFRNKSALVFMLQFWNPKEKPFEHLCFKWIR